MWHNLVLKTIDFSKSKNNYYVISSDNRIIDESQIFVSSSCRLLIKVTALEIDMPIRKLLPMTLAYTDAIGNVKECIMKSFKEQAIDTVLDEIVETGASLYDNPYRVGSQMYYEVFKEARSRLLEGKLRLSELNREILETDIGEYDIYENELVPLHHQ